MTIDNAAVTNKPALVDAGEEKSGSHGDFAPKNSGGVYAAYI